LFLFCFLCFTHLPVFVGVLGYCSLALSFHTVSPLIFSASYLVALPFPRIIIRSCRLCGASAGPLRISSQAHYTHPDQARVNYVCKLLQYGFHFGFSPDLALLHSSTRNLKSAGEHPVVVDQY
jgi:hypothetical protein